MKDSVVVVVEALTPRETEVLGELALGHDNAAIGVSLFITPRTVKTHLGEIFSKLGVTTRLEAVLTAQELGLVVSPNHLSPAATVILALIVANPGVLSELIESGALDEEKLL